VQRYLLKAKVKRKKEKGNLTPCPSPLRRGEPGPSFSSRRRSWRMRSKTSEPLS